MLPVTPDDHAKPQNAQRVVVWRDLIGLPGLLLLLIAQLVFLFYARQVNLDEGWYLWASKLVYEGKLLYRDFAYTQTPLLPYVYGLAQRLFGEGLAQGRALTILFALATVALSVRAAAHLGGRNAAFCTLALITVSSFALAQFAYTATYALAALLLAAALCWAVIDPTEDRRNMGAAAFLCLAVAVRFSLIAILPGWLLYLLITSCRRRRAVMLLGGTTFLTLGLTLGIYWLAAGDLMRYDIFGFHTDRLLRSKWQQLRIWNMGLRTLEDFLLLIGATVAAGLVGIWQLWSTRHASTEDVNRTSGWLLVTLAGLTGLLFVVHLIPRTTDSYYNALQLPWMSVAAGVILARWLQRTSHNRQPYLWLLIGLLCLGHGARQWRGFQRDQYVPTPWQNQLAIVERAADLLRRFTEPGETLLSFNPQLALEANLRVHPGYEMAIFAYQPTWPDDDVARYQVVNNARLLADLQRGAAAVAFTEFDLAQIAGEAEQVQRILTEQYRWAASIPQFDPYGGALSLYFPPQFELPTPQVATQALFEDQIHLLGYDLTHSYRGASPTVTVAFYWQAARPPSAAYTVFVQLLDPNGHLAVGWDNQPCRNSCGTPTWQPAEIVRDEYTLSLAGLPSGTYQLIMGMYDPTTGLRLGVRRASEEVQGDYLAVTTVEYSAE